MNRNPLLIVARARNEKPSANTIAAYYQKLSGKTIEMDALVQKLKEAEQAGLITQEIDVSGDVPKLIWKSQIASSENRHLFKMNPFKR
ncbi:hypothetical protein MUP77_19305 [Candidatus Bathyarchaeota archaeon]|nr:hypothetical protein [Candidatus Bathyarchaeota archaeon]